MKDLKRVEIVDDKINFVCLKEECPQSCCGPFGGVQRGIDSVEGRDFSEIILTDEDSKGILASGYSNLIELTDHDNYRMKLLLDGTCSAFVEGRCTVHRIKPTICKAFPLYVDMFVGLCAITSCPGFGAGWTRIDRLYFEIEASKKMYNYWLTLMENKKEME